MGLRYLLLLTTTLAVAGESPDLRRTQSGLEEVVISATRSPNDVMEAPATVSVITGDDVDRLAVADIKDLMRYEPGVSVRNQSGRFGLSDFNVRGVDGNRVLLEVDGVRLPDAFSIGSFSNATRDAVDVDLLKRVEIVRGSVSSLYGSDAIGGVISFTTKDPDDLLRDGESLHLGAKLSYAEQDEGVGGLFTLAARGDALSGLLAYSRRDTGDYANQGANAALDATRTTPNPQDGRLDSVLAKGVWDISASQRLTLVGEFTRAETEVDVLSSVTSSPTASLRTTALDADDSQRRERVSLSYRATDFGIPIVDEIEAQAYWQDSETEQLTFEERLVTAAGGASRRKRERAFEFTQREVGGDITLRKSFEFAGLQHRVTYGVEHIETDTAQQRDGREINLTTGAVSSTVGPDAFPVRDFPLTLTRQSGLYLQNEMRWGRWTFTPSIRADRFEVVPELDPVFVADNPGIEPTRVRESSISPRLGVVYRPIDAVALFSSYSAGFRAPPYSDVNVGFTNFAFPPGYTAIPNPDLQPETSDSVEVGVRLRGDAGFVTLSGYHNDYDDFIESFVFVGTVPPGDPVRPPGASIFQSRNAKRVRIYGAELAGRWLLGSVAEPLANWSMKGALSYARGSNRARNVPINEVDPPTAVIGIAYSPAAQRWGLELVTTAVAAKEDIDQSGTTVGTGPLFAAPGYTTFDLLSNFRFGESVQLNVAVFNLTDKTYWHWADVRGRFASDTALDRFTRPGRMLSANLKLEW
jgi:hemoglobin/transferrin/lactoferrin receptor protein